jgi:aquaporin Z
MADTSTPPTLIQKLAAEAFGTFVLVFLGCGSAVYAAGAARSNEGGLAFVPTITTVGLTFGLAIVIMAYAFGRVSGGHFNPAVSVGAALAGRISWAHAGMYSGAQVGGALLGALLLRILMEGFPGYDVDTVGLGANTFGDAGTGYSWLAAFPLEAVLTAVFVIVILAVTDGRNEHPALAPLAIGLALAAIHFVAIPATGTSVNPARSIGPAIWTFDLDVILQLWLFILAPLAGAAAAGFLYPMLFGRSDEPVPGSGLGFTKAPAAVPGYGAPDQFQQQWNQEWPQQTTAPMPSAGGYEPGGYEAPGAHAGQPGDQSGVQAQPSWTEEEDGRTVVKGAGDLPSGSASTGSATVSSGQKAAPADQPVIIQDGWQWDYAAQQWKPVEQPPQQQG